MFAENVDKIINIDFGDRGIIHKLCEAARNLINEPLTFKVCKEIKENVKERINYHYYRF